MGEDWSSMSHSPGVVEYLTTILYAIIIKLKNNDLLDLCHVTPPLPTNDLSNQTLELAPATLERSFDTIFAPFQCISLSVTNSMEHFHADLKLHIFLSSGINYNITTQAVYFACHYFFLSLPIIPKRESTIA